MIKLQSVNREARWQSSLLCGLWRRLYWEALGGGRRGCKTCSGWFKILLNNCLSAAEHRVAKSLVSLSQKPDRLLLLRNACSFRRSPKTSCQQWIRHLSTPALSTGLWPLYAIAQLTQCVINCTSSGAFRNYRYRLKTYLFSISF